MKSLTPSILDLFIIFLAPAGLDRAKTVFSEREVAEALSKEEKQFAADISMSVGGIL